jgi:hypothetical protein
MQSHRGFFSAVLLSAALLGSSTIAASANEIDRHDGGDHAVFVQSNDLGKNQVLAYHRSDNGALTPAGTYDTGGKGGRIEGSVVDPLASQHSLVYSRQQNMLVGVNAGSNTVYAFDVDGDRLGDRQVLASGGVFPVSVAVHDDLVYVLDSGGAGAVQGFRMFGHHLEAIPGSNRSLGLTPVTGPTAFLNTPGQVGFTPDGSQLIVTTKANGSNIDVFGVRFDGRLSQTPVQNGSATPVPFGFVFDPSGRLVVAEAGSSEVSTYVLHDNGKLTPIASLPDNQAALCWIVRADGTYFTANAGSGSVSGYRVSPSGQLTLVGTTAVGAGTIDLAASHGGAFLYVELGGPGTVAALEVNADGSLTPIGSPTAPHPGIEGIAAT